MEIGIKFCGGCNPEYNRNELYKIIREKYNVDNDVSIAEDGFKYDLLIVICGCLNACADHKKIFADYKITLAAAEDFKKLDNYILKI